MRRMTETTNEINKLFGAPDREADMRRIADRFSAELKSDMTHHPDEEFEKALVKFESAVGQHEYIFSRDPVGSDAQDAGRRKAEAKKKLIDSHQTAISLAREEERNKILKVEPTDRQVRSICLSMDHSFGLQDAKTQEWAMTEAKGFIRAWQKELEHFPQPITP